MSRTRLHPLVFLVGAAVCAPGWAIPGSALELFGRVGWSRDDNLLRVPDNEPAFDNQRADSWTTAEFGVVVDKTIRRQRLFAVAKLSKVSFDHFRQLDYDGKDLQATWYWEVGKRFSGRLGTTYTRTLAPYTDFRSSERNLRRQRHAVFDGGWKLHPRWEVRTQLARDKFDYALSVQAYNNRTEDVAELEGRYLVRSGSTVGLVLRRIEGDYPNRRPFAARLLTDDFTQKEAKLRVDWTASGASTLQALAGYARRTQPSFGRGHTSGANGRIALLHEPNGKLSYRAAVWRDFAPLESTLVSHTLNKGASIGATWAATAKLRVDADAIHERRNYAPRNGSSAAHGLDDSLRSGSLKVSWAVKRKVSVSVAYLHQARTGSAVLGIGNVKSNTLALNASAQF